MPLLKCIIYTRQVLLHITVILIVLMTNKVQFKIKKLFWLFTDFKKYRPPTAWSRIQTISTVRSYCELFGNFYIYSDIYSRLPFQASQLSSYVLKFAAKLRFSIEHFTFFIYEPHQNIDLLHLQ